MPVDLEVAQTARPLVGEQLDRGVAQQATPLGGVVLPFALNTGDPTSGSLLCAEIAFRQEKCE
ncbi:hypothetical protein ASG82_14215 [Mycobacterium sp. Soil538]|nr:hypothetical protein ASG82_14215 [Mycobacterium sp. Soil538]